MGDILLVGAVIDIVLEAGEYGLGVPVHDQHAGGAGLRGTDQLLQKLRPSLRVAGRFIKRVEQVGTRGGQ